MEPLRITRVGRPSPILAILLFQYSLVAGVVHSQAADGYTIEGRASADGKPLEGMVIILAPREHLVPIAEEEGLYRWSTEVSTTSKANGTFRFNDVPPGEYVVCADSPGEAPFRGFTNRTVGPRGSSHTVILGGESSLVEPGGVVRSDLALGGYLTGTVRVEFRDSRRPPLIGFHEERFPLYLDLAQTIEGMGPGGTTSIVTIPWSSLRSMEWDDTGRVTITLTDRVVRLDHIVRFPPNGSLTLIPRYQPVDRGYLGQALLTFAPQDRMVFDLLRQKVIRRISWLRDEEVIPAEIIPSVDWKGKGGLSRVVYYDELGGPAGEFQSFDPAIRERELIEIFRILPNATRLNLFSRVNRSLSQAIRQGYREVDEARFKEAWEAIRAYGESGVPDDCKALLKSCSKWLEESWLILYSMKCFLVGHDIEQFRTRMSPFLWDEEMERIARSIGEDSTPEEKSRAWNAFSKHLASKDLGFDQDGLNRLQEETLRRLKLRLERFPIREDEDRCAVGSSLAA